MYVFIVQQSIERSVDQQWILEEQKYTLATRELVWKWYFFRLSSVKWYEWRKCRLKKRNNLHTHGTSICCFRTSVSDIETFIDCHLVPSNKCSIVANRVHSHSEWNIHRAIIQRWICYERKLFHGAVRAPCDVCVSSSRFNATTSLRHWKLNKIINRENIDIEFSSDLSECLCGGSLWSLCKRSEQQR